MTAQFELERILDDFLGEGTDELSADVLEAALLDVRYTDQRRAHPGPRRTEDMSSPLRLLAVAAILVAGVGGAVILGSSVRNDGKKQSTNTISCIVAHDLLEQIMNITL